MNRRLVSYYNKELRFLREVGQEFARQYPKIASRLNLNENETPDPYVERLLEGVAFLTARTQLKIDSEYPKFVQRILEVVYPQFLYPTPASSIVRFDTSNHYNVNIINKIKRNYVLESLPIEIGNESLNCQFSVTQDTELTPIELESSSYNSALDYLPDLKGVDIAKSQSALRLNFSIKSSSSVSELMPNDLVLFLGSNLPVSSQLLFLLMSTCNGVICHSFEDGREWNYLLAECPQQKGFEDGEALLFDLNKSISSLRILQEYIQLPEKFLFVSQNGINKALRQAELDGHISDAAEQVEEITAQNGVNKRVVSYKKRWFSVSFLFNHYIQDLSQLMKESDITINATPIVNLFKKKSVRFPVNIEDIEHHVVIDRVKPLNYEVHSIERVKGYDRFNNQQIIFTPIYQAKDHSVFIKDDYSNAFFSIRRESRTPSTLVTEEGGRTSYSGSEAYLSMMSESESILSSNIDHLAVEAWCTNRDLPLILTRSKQSDFLVDSALPIRAVHIISEVTKPITTVDEDQTLWSLLNQLNLSYVSLVDNSDYDSTLLIKELLLAFPHSNRGFYNSEVNSIKQFQAQPVTRIERHRGIGSIRKGVLIKLVFDESLLAGINPYLFSSILKHYFTCSISINSFLEMTVETIQQGKIIEWDSLSNSEKSSR